MSETAIKDTHDSGVWSTGASTASTLSRTAIKDTHDSGSWSTGASTASTLSRDVREVDSAQGVSRDPAQR
jgi:hypothetical protein